MFTYMKNKEENIERNIIFFDYSILSEKHKTTNR
jgi:hypothetical protein